MLLWLVRVAGRAGEVFAVPPPFLDELLLLLELLLPPLAAPWPAGRFVEPPWFPVFRGKMALLARALGTRISLSCSNEH